MPTLRVRPSRGSDVLSPEGAAAAIKSPPNKTPTRRGHQRRSGAMAGDAIEVRESIEAKGDKDEDVIMGDAIDAKDEPDAAADADADADADVDAEGDEDAEGEPDEDMDADADADADAEGEPDDEDPNTQQRRDQRALLNLIDETQSYLSNYKEEGDDEELARGFQRLPNKRFLPDYFDVIKTPIAFSTIRAKILKKGYTSFNEFVRDVAQIFHNAQVYNRPSAGVYGAAIRLRILFKDKLEELIKKGVIKPEEAEFPDLGEIPEVEDSPPPEYEEEDEEEDEEDDEEDSDDEGTRRRGRRRGRRSKKEVDDDEEAPAKKRGRPPKVFTPLEGRIYAILKGLRRFKNDKGELRVLPFERLPDKGLEKDYYAVIKNPIALDGIKRNYKRKKYNSVDQVLADLDLLFENAKTYNEEGSDVYEDAVELQKQAHILAEQEKAKPDDAFRDEDGKLPLAGIEYKGEVWKVGDWVHINNPNDPRKPIVAQIYRTWQDREGHRWVNACWYYRPEQTVHHYEKHFYENEVVKTGQYRDHRIEEIDDRCFVMFITRYPKGRPRGFPRDKSVYVCESRYNEEKYTFNKIKTWASCLPDEVREKDYEMDLYPVPIRMKKVPSPIKHLLQVDAKETDDLPKPTWSNSNAPPMIGAVHRRPREPNESPPPEPTPPPMAAPRVPQIPMDPTRRQSFNSHDVSMTGTYQPTAAMPGPSPSPVPHYSHQFQPTPGARPVATPTPPVPVQQFQVPSMIPGSAPVPQPPVAPAPHYSPHPAYTHQQQFAPGPVAPAHQAPSPMPIAYNQSPARHIPSPAMMGTPSRTPMAPAPNVNSLPHANAQGYSNQYNVPRTHEVYRLMDPQFEASIPAEVREQFQRDDEGRLLWFTAAGRDRSALHGVAPEYAGLGHSVSHLAHIGEVREERKRKRKERDERLAVEAEEAMKRTAGGEGKEEDERKREEDERKEIVRKALVGLAQEIEKGNKVVEEGLGGWRGEKRLWDEERKAVLAKGTGE